MEIRLESSNNPTEAEGRNCLCPSLDATPPHRSFVVNFLTSCKQLRAGKPASPLFLPTFGVNTSGPFLDNYYRIFPSSLRKLVSLIPFQRALEILVTLRHFFAWRTCENFLTKKVSKTTPKHRNTPGGANSKPIQTFCGRHSALWTCGQLANQQTTWMTSSSPSCLRYSPLDFRGWALENMMHKVDLPWSRRRLWFFPQISWCDRKDDLHSLTRIKSKQADSDVVCSTSLCWKLKELV